VTCDLASLAKLSPLASLEKLYLNLEYKERLPGDTQWSFETDGRELRRYVFALIEAQREGREAPPPLLAGRAAASNPGRVDARKAELRQEIAVLRAQVEALERLLQARKKALEKLEGKR